MSEEYIALDRIDKNLQKIYDYTAGRWSLVTEIPAIEIVRCKNCKYSGDFKDGVGYCHYYLDTHIIKETDFCSKGKEHE